MAKAVLLLHGWLSDVNDFSSLLPFLKKHYDHIERITYPGHGKGENYEDFDEEKTIALVDQTFLNLQKQYEEIDVIGFSMGGALGVYLSQKYDFNKLVLLAPAIKYFNLMMPFSKIRHLIKCGYYFEKAALLKNEKEKEEFKERLKCVFEDDKYCLNFARTKYLKLYFRHAFKNFQKVIEKANENLIEITNPTFLAWGELDQLVPKDSVTYLFDLCTNENKQLMIYEDLSHILILSKANEKIVKDIEEFLKN